jgi:membrane protease YdiL (CAAX protease family)
LILDSAGYFVFDGLAGDRNETLLNGIVWWITFTCTGIGEELLFRGYLQSTLSRIMGFWPAAVLCSVLFCLAHLNNSGEAVIGIAQVFIAGMVFATIRRFSGSLWLGIGVHAGWDWGQSFFYGTADSGLVVEGHLFNTHPTGDILLSGGPVGPEGSVLAAPVVVLSLCIMLVVSRRVGWLQWSRTAPSP